MCIRDSAGRYIGVFLGCRCSEYLGPDIDWDKIILTSDVRPMMGHQYCEWSDEFDGLMVTFRGSKTDQYNEGCKRYVGMTGNPRCAVLALREWYTLQPSHFERSDVVPLFTMPDGGCWGELRCRMICGGLRCLRGSRMRILAPIRSACLVRRGSTKRVTILSISSATVGGRLM